MKKIITLAAAVLLSAGSQAQVMSNYLPSVAVGTYEEITGGTVVPHQKDGGVWDNMFFTPSGISENTQFRGQGFPIGFDVTYNGQVMNQFGIAAHGFITLGKDKVALGALNKPGFFPFDASFNSDYPNIVGFTTRGTMKATATTEVSYKVVGEAPQRELVVQYKDVNFYQESFEEPPLKATGADLQVRVCENGDLRIVFHDFNLVSSYSPRHNFDAVRLGIQGTNKDHLIKMDDFLGDGFSSAPSKEFDWNDSNPIPDGLTYTFKLPSPCVTPQLPVVLNYVTLQTATDAVSGTFLPAGDSDHTLILIAKQGETAGTPADGVIYQPGQKLGSATVLAYTEDGTFTSERVTTLTGGTGYDLYFIAANAKCTGGPLYAATPAKTSFTTAAAAPSASLAAVEPTSLTLNLTANSAGDNILVAYTTTPFLDVSNAYHPRGSFGQPAGTLAAGSSIDGGGTVAYVGPAQAAITVSNLPAGVPVFVAAWSIDANGYSTSKAEVAAHTVATLPWAADFDQAPLAEVPVGWQSADDTWAIQYSADNHGYLDCRDFVIGGDTYLVTPLVDLTKGNIAVLFDGMFYVWSYMSSSAWTPAADDYVKVDYQEEGTTAWVNVITWQGSELTTLIGSGTSYNTWKGIFTMAEAKRVRLRFTVKTSQTIQSRLTNFKVEETTEGGGGQPQDEPKECVTPTGMAVSDVTDTSVKLTWTAGENNLTWNVRYRESAASSWTEQPAVAETNATLTGLTPSTAYVWQVKATCEDNESAWTRNQRFSTIATAIDQVGIGGVQVFLKGRVLNVVNPAGGLLHSIQVFSTDGKLLGDYPLATTDNAFIRLPLSGPVVVKVNGQQQSKTVKLGF